MSLFLTSWKNFKREKIFCVCNDINLLDLGVDVKLKFCVNFSLAFSLVFLFFFFWSFIQTNMGEFFKILISPFVIFFWFLFNGWILFLFTPWHNFPTISSWVLCKGKRFVAFWLGLYNMWQSMFFCLTWKWIHLF